MLNGLPKARGEGCSSFPVCVCVHACSCVCMCTCVPVCGGQRITPGATPQLMPLLFSRQGF